MVECTLLSVQVLFVQHVFDGLQLCRNRADHPDSRLRDTAG